MEVTKPAQKANISCCDHSFCFECIEKWAKKYSNNCPVCKLKFNKIIRTDKTGKTEEIEVKN